MSKINTIIVTRPEPFADDLAEILSERDFGVEKLPLIDFVGNQEFLAQTDFASVEAADYLIFVSQQAVHYFFQAFNEQQVSNLKNKTLIAVGKATQESLASFNQTGLIPERFDSEGILQLLAELNPNNASLRILLVCGNQGRKLLEESLSEQHQLTRLETYQRIGKAQTFPKIVEADKIAIVVTSEQLLDLSLHQLSLQETAQMQISEKSLRKTIAFICASSRIAESAHQKGVINCYTAKSASNQDLANACLEWRERQELRQQDFANPITSNQSETMSESDQHENEIIEALELDQEPETNEPTTKKSGVLKPLFWLLILGALGYGGYWLWQQGYFSTTNTENPTNELTRIVNLEKQLQAQSTQIQGLLSQQNQQVSSQAAEQQELRRQVESLQQQLIASQRKFQSLSADAATQARDWQIAEAEYLIRQAAQKVHYSDDTNSIIALLETADQQILASGDSNLLPLRRAISQDIAQIRATSNIDIDGILVKLDTIETQLASLNLASVKFEDKTESTTNEEAENLDSSAWQTFKTNMRDTFSDYYKIHHYDQSVKPFINPQQADMLQQNILMSAKMAQLSALRHQQSSYDQSIQELASWIQEFYQADDQSKLLLDQLALLANAKVTIALPNKLQSLEFVKQNNQDRLNQWLNSTTFEQAPNEDELEEMEQSGESGDIDKTIQQALKRMDTDEEPDDESTDNGEQE